MFSGSIYHRLLILITCIGGFVFNFAFAYPGFIAVDGFDQYQQAIANQYNDWHAPIMAYVWHCCLLLHSTTALMLGFQLALLWTSIYVLLSTIINRYWYLGMLLMAFAPFIQNFAGFLVKDAHMAFSWLLVVAILFRTQIMGKRLSGFALPVCVLILLYGSWVRINAWPGAFVLSVFVARAIWPKIALKRAFVCAIAFTIVSLITQNLFSYHYLKCDKTYPQAKLFLHDITGIYAQTGKAYYPSFLFQSPLFDTAVLRNAYHPATFDHLWVRGNDEKLIYDFDNDSEVNILKQAWLHAIIQHPFAYIHNRFNGLLYYLKLKESGKPYYAYYFNIAPQPNSMGITQAPSGFRNVFSKGIIMQKNMPYMRPWFWVLANVLLLGFLGKFRNTAAAHTYATLLLSALAYILPTFLIFPCDSDFRYFYYNAIASTLAFLILLLDRFYFTETT